MSAASWDVVVVGGGMIGAAIAYEAARRKLSCLLVEGGHLASGASGANMGLIELQDVQLGPMTPLTLTGFARMAQLEAELDYDLEYQRHGTLLLLRDEEEVARSRSRVQALNQAGIPLCYVPAEDVARIEPAVDTRELAGALYLEEAQMNPLALVHALADRAQALGATIRVHCPVLGLQATGRTITGLTLGAEVVGCGSVVLATGAWTARLLAPMGSALPFWIIKGQAAVTEPIPPLLHGFVGLAFSRRADLERRVAAEGWEALAAGSGPPLSVISPAVTQTRHGSLILGQASEIAREADSQVMEWGLPALAGAVLRYLPGLARCSVLRTWASPVPFTLDHEPILGPLPGYDNLFVAAGFKSAMVIAPTVAARIADWLVSGEAPADLAAFTADRFHIQKGTEQYATASH